MCPETTYRASGSEAPSQRTAINMLLLWSKGMRFGYYVAFHLCLLRKSHNNSLMKPTFTLSIFIIELTLRTKRHRIFATTRQFSLRLPVAFSERLAAVSVLSDS